MLPSKASCRLAKKCIAVKDSKRVEIEVRPLANPVSAAAFKTSRQITKTLNQGELRSPRKILSNVVAPILLQI